MPGDCPLCQIPVAKGQDYTVLHCCGASRRFHAGCLHREFVCGSRACPSCGSEPRLPFEAPPGSMPTSTPPRAPSEPRSRSIVRTLAFLLAPDAEPEPRLEPRRRAPPP